MDQRMRHPLALFVAAALGRFVPAGQPAPGRVHCPIHCLEPVCRREPSFLFHSRQLHRERSAVRSVASRFHAAPGLLCPGGGRPVSGGRPGNRAPRRRESGPGFRSAVSGAAGRAQTGCVGALGAGPERGDSLVAAGGRAGSRGLRLSRAAAGRSPAHPGFPCTAVRGSSAGSGGAFSRLGSTAAPGAACEKSGGKAAGLPSGAAGLDSGFAHCSRRPSLSVGRRQPARLRSVRLQFRPGTGAGQSAIPAPSGRMAGGAAGNRGVAGAAGPGQGACSRCSPAAHPRRPVWNLVPGRGRFRPGGNRSPGVPAPGGCGGSPPRGTASGEGRRRAGKLAGQHQPQRADDPRAGAGRGGSVHHALCRHRSLGLPAPGPAPGRSAAARNRRTADDGATGARPRDGADAVHRKGRRRLCGHRALSDRSAEPADRGGVLPQRRMGPMVPARSGRTPGHRPDSDDPGRNQFRAKQYSGNARARTRMGAVLTHHVRGADTGRKRRNLPKSRACTRP